jgi:hypothetical protein
MIDIINNPPSNLTMTKTLLANELKKRGIMAEIYKGLKKKFVAESPRNLQQMVDENRAQLDEFMPTLMNMYQFPETGQTLKSTEGVEGIRNGLDSMLADIEVGDYYLVIANFETVHELLPKFLPKFLERRATHNIKIRTVLQDGERARWYKDNQKRFNDTVKILPKDFEFSANIVLTPHRVLFPQLLPYTGAVVIENTQVVNTMEQVFEMVWSSIPEN